MKFHTINPVNDEVLEEHFYLDSIEIDRILLHCKKQQKLLSQTPIQDRCHILFELSRKLIENKERLARQMTLEMGKPILESRAEVEKSASAFDFYAKNAERLLKTQKLKAHYAETEIFICPLGPILAIMPWNFPLWQVARFLAPAVAIGNVVLLKHSDLVAGFAKTLEKLMNEVSPRKFLFNLCIDHDQTAKVIADRRIRGVTFTGSRLGGSAIAQLAGKNLKKSVLELGGSDPYIIFEDADVEVAAQICVQSRMLNGGQSCVAAKRFLVHESVKEIFIKNFVHQTQKYMMGDPQNEQTTLGPLAHKKFQTQLNQQANQLIQEGCLVHLKGGSSEGKGSYFSPIVLESHSGIFNQNLDRELFGPVSQIVSFKSEEEAVVMANQSNYGLGAAVFTKNIERGKKILVEQIEGGVLALNDMVRSDSRVPFGGVKDSGYGRELGEAGLFEFANIKALGVKQ